MGEGEGCHSDALGTHIELLVHSEPSIFSITAFQESVPDFAEQSVLRISGGIILHLAVKKKARAFLEFLKTMFF